MDSKLFINRNVKNTAKYPYHHSTYFTGGDPINTSELPPMNSMEDILQEIFMRDRNRVYGTSTTTSSSGYGYGSGDSGVPKCTPCWSVRRVVRKVKKWTRLTVKKSSFTSLPLLPGSMRLVRRDA